MSLPACPSTNTPATRASARNAGARSTCHAPNSRAWFGPWSNGSDLPIIRQDRQDAKFAKKSIEFLLSWRLGPSAAPEEPMRIAILTTGGTIEKRYDETDGSLRNVGSVLEEILRSLRLPTLEVRHVSVMSKDSLDMTDEDRQTILRSVREALATDDAVLIVHGTDTLHKTG